MKRTKPVFLYFLLCCLGLGSIHSFAHAKGKTRLETPAFGPLAPLSITPPLPQPEMISTDPSLEKRPSFVAGFSKDSTLLFYCVQQGMCAYQKVGSSKEILLENPEDREEEVLDLQTGEKIPPLSTSQRKKLQQAREKLMKSIVSLSDQNWPYAGDFSVTWKATNRDSDFVDEEDAQKFRKKHPLRLQIGAQVLGLEHPTFVNELVIPWEQDSANDIISPVWIALSPNKEWLGVVAARYRTNEFSDGYSLKMISIKEMVCKIYFLAGKQFLQQKNKEKAVSFLQKALFLSLSKNQKQEILAFLKKQKVSLSKK